MSAISPLKFPICTIDFEASSLEQDSYPIEVGVAIWPAPGEPITAWSSLIRPVWEWREEGHWSRRSERVHGISRDSLSSGHAPREVATQLNTLLAPDRVAFCDGGSFDDYWLERLFDAAGLDPSFRLGSWQTVLKPLDLDTQERMRAWEERTPPAHRARADAERLLLSLAHGVRLTPAAGDLGGNNAEQSDR